MNQSGRLSSRPTRVTKKTSRVTLPNNAPSFAKTSSPSTRLNANPIHTTTMTNSPTKPTRNIKVTPSTATRTTMTTPNRGYNNNKFSDKGSTMKTTQKSRSAPFIPEKEIMKAISEILAHTVSTTSFSEVYKAARNLSSQSANEIFEQLKIEYSNRLDDIDISSIQKLITEWKLFQTEICQIQSFMKFVGLNDIKSQYDTLPHWKYKETIKNHSNKCMTIGINIWKSDVHTRAMHILHDEIQNSIKSLAKGDQSNDQITKELFDLLSLLGQNCIDQVRELFVAEYDSLDSKVTSSDRINFIINKTKKLTVVFPLTTLQPITVVPYLNDLLPELLKKRLPEPLIELKNFLLPEFIPKYTSIICEQMKKVSLPIDYFSLVSFLEFYSSIMFNDAPVRTLVSSFISKSDSKFPQNFVSVIFGHFELIQNVKQLSQLVPLYADKEALSNELVRAFLLRLLQKHSQVKDKEIKFAHELLCMFSNEQMRSVFSMLRDYTIEKNLIVMNSSLTMPLIQNDHSKLPPEFEKPITAELTKYSEKFYNRKFTVSSAFTLYYVKAKWEGEKEDRLIVMSALQYHLIQMMLVKNNDFKSTQAGIDTLNMALKCLVKAKIVKKEGGLFVISEEAPKEKRINVFMKAIDIRYNERQKLAQSHDHSMSIQSVISKIMKANRKMDENELISRVTEELSALFNIRDGDVPKVIDHMIEAEFVERDSSDTRFLVYIP